MKYVTTAFFFYVIAVLGWSLASPQESEFDPERLKRIEIASNLKIIRHGGSN